jgi:acyl-CoA synthetase (AMP-forming)/AMP-acid ligase II
VIPNAGDEVDETELLAYCREHLPGYAVPLRIEILAEFPRTSSGKIRRKELVKVIK